MPIPKTMRTISQGHVNIGLKILEKEKFVRQESFSSDKKRRVEEIDYCERLIKALFEDYQTIKKQPKLV